MEKSSFFNSVKGDRKYSAEDWAAYFGSIIGNGVFPQPSNGLQVEKYSGMHIRVQSGKAWIHDYIEKLPNRYETQVGECGGQLSGGQKQRIAIARAFLRDAEVFVFDEATSALDAETEREIQERIDAVCRNKTTITITHRINSVKNADRILVLESGKVIEEGNFKTLLEKNGNFSRLYRTQMSTKMFAKEEYPEIY